MALHGHARRRLVQLRSTQETCSRIHLLYLFGNLRSRASSDQPSIDSEESAQALPSGEERCTKCSALKGLENSSKRWVKASLGSAQPLSRIEHKRVTNTPRIGHLRTTWNPEAKSGCRGKWRTSGGPDRSPRPEEWNDDWWEPVDNDDKYPSLKKEKGAHVWMSLRPSHQHLMQD